MFKDDLVFSKWQLNKNSLFSYHRFEKFGNHLFIFRATEITSADNSYMVALSMEDEQTRKEIFLGMYKPENGLDDKAHTVNQTITRLNKLFNDIVPF